MKQKVLVGGRVDREWQTCDEEAERVKAKSARLLVGPRDRGIIAPGIVVAIDANRFIARDAAGNDDGNDDDGSRRGVSKISSISRSS